MSVVVFCLFLPSTENQYQTESKWNKLYDDFSWTRRNPGDLERRLEDLRGGNGGAPPGLWAPRRPSNPNSCSINTQIFPLHQKRPQKYFSAAASFCSREIPSSGLFWHSAGGGFDHGGPLHQPCCSSDEA